MPIDRQRRNATQRTTPLEWWGRLIVRFPRAFLGVPLLLCVLLAPLALQGMHDLSALGWTPEHAESHRAQEMMAEEFGHTTTNHYILFSDPTGALHADDREFRLEVERVMRAFRNDPDVVAVYTWGSTRNDILNDMLISSDRSKSLAVIVMERFDAPGTGQMDELLEALASDRLSTQIGGWPATAETFLDLARDDLTRSEIFALPLTLLVLVIVFGGLLAAGLPIILAILSVIVTLALLAILSRITLVSLFAVNAITMLGLAVGIDYALIMVGRFREESDATAVADSLPRVLATGGRTVLVAGSTVAIGLLGLVLFGVPAAVSTGLAGAAVVLACVGLALTALPAAFVLWGERIGRRRVRGLSRRRRIRAVAERIERWRERHPMLVIVACLVLLVGMALPLRHIVVSSPTMTILPRESEARIVYDTIAEEFPEATLSPITLVVQPRTGSMMGAENLTRLKHLAEDLALVDGIVAVDSVWGYMPPGITPDGYATSLLLEPEMVNASAPFLTRNAALITLTPDPALDADGRRELVSDLRTVTPDLTARKLNVLIAGDSAIDLDLMQQVQERIPWVIGSIVGLTWVALFVQFRSVAIPFKAILLNLCSLGASFGALVWIFQDGHLSGLFRFEPTGYTVILVPILMFCFLFGLSMDFEVIMLSRIKEAWQETGDNTRAIDIGLHRSAGIVTSSAAVMLIVFAAFGASELQVIKSLGVGLGIAVFIDATIIRLLLLPATMQLMGRWNWWAPKWRPLCTRRTSFTTEPLCSSTRGWEDY